MATPYVNSAEGGTTGATVTVGNSGGASGTAFSFARNTEFSAAVANTGTRSYKIYGDVNNRVEWDMAATNTAAMRAYFYLPQYPTNHDVHILRMGNTLLGVTASNSGYGVGRAVVRHASLGGERSNSISQLPLNQWFRVEVRADYTTKTWWVDIFNPDGTTLWSASQVFNSLTTINEADVGSMNFDGTNATGLPFLYADDLAFDNTSSSPIGPVGGGSGSISQTLDSTYHVLTPNLLNYADATFESPGLTWIGTGNATDIVRSTTYAAEGTYSMRVQNSSGGAAPVKVQAGAYGKPEAIPVTGGQQYSILASARVDSGSGLSGNLYVVWFDSAGNSILFEGSNTITGVGTSGFTQGRNLVTAPANAAFLELDIEINNVPGFAHIYWDKVGVFKGDTTTWSAPVAPVMSVSQTLDSTYGVKARVATTTSSSYHVMTALSNVVNAAWAVKCVIFVDTVSIYKVMQALTSQSPQFSWSLLSLLSTTVDSTYAIRTSLASEQDSAYRVLTSAEGFLSAEWELGGSVQSETLSRWDVAAQATASAAFSWNVSPLAFRVFNTADGGEPGTSATTSTSGGASGTAFSTVWGTPPVFSNTFRRILTGQTYKLGIPMSGFGQYVALQTQDTAAHEVSTRFYINIGTLTTFSTIDLMSFRSGGIALATVSISSKNLVAQAAGGVAHGSNLIPTNQWIRIEANYSTVTGYLNAYLYLGDSTTPIDSILSIGTGDQTPIDSVWFGDDNYTTSSAPQMYLDDLAYQTGSLELFGPAGHSVSTTADSQFGIRRLVTGAMSFDSTWTVRARATGTAQAAWDIQAHMSAQQQSAYAARETISEVTYSDWDVRELTHNTVDIDYDIRALISDGVEAEWITAANPFAFQSSRWRIEPDFTGGVDVIGSLGGALAGGNLGGTNSSTTLPGTGRTRTLAGNNISAQLGGTQTTIER